MRPTFQAYLREDDSYLVEITPNPFFSNTKKRVVLTKDAYETGFVPWLQGHKSIQAAFPTTPTATRELFLTGMNTAEWNQMIGPEE